MTRLWTYEMNYMRLAISWVQLLGMLVMIVWTVCSYRALKLSATKKRSHGSLPAGLPRLSRCRF